MRLAFVLGPHALLSDTICSRRLSLFGHFNRADHCQSHYQTLEAYVTQLKTAD